MVCSGLTELPFRLAIQQFRRDKHGDIHATVSSVPCLAV